MHIDHGAHERCGEITSARRRRTRRLAAAARRRRCAAGEHNPRCRDRRGGGTRGRGSTAHKSVDAAGQVAGRVATLAPANPCSCSGDRLVTKAIASAFCAIAPARPSSVNGWAGSHSRNAKAPGQSAVASSTSVHPMHGFRQPWVDVAALRLDAVVGRVQRSHARPKPFRRCYDIRRAP